MPRVTLHQVADLDAADVAAFHRLLHDVAATGAAIGFLVPPTPAESGALLDGWLAAVREGDGGLVWARVDGVLQGSLVWLREGHGVFRLVGDVRKLLVHPDARGLGLGARLLAAVVAAGEEAGLEFLTLDCRGNNHYAIQLYEEAGFVRHGLLPDVIAVGDERHDLVLMHRVLNRPGHVARHGSQVLGEGASARRRRGDGVSTTGS